MTHYNNNVRAVISLTSWKARITTVGLTIYSLLLNCPDYHIVLVLSLEEFPGGVNSLPYDIRTLANTSIIEILWVSNNVRAFKKVLYTMATYPHVPVISADDDCFYTTDYASILYNRWSANKQCIYTLNGSTIRGITFPHGPATLYPPGSMASYAFRYIYDRRILETNHDDAFYGMVAKHVGIPVVSISHQPVYKFHNTVLALSNGRTSTCKHMIDICTRLFR